jgi:hypothetical protein
LASVSVRSVDAGFELAGRVAASQIGLDKFAAVSVRSRLGTTHKKPEKPVPFFPQGGGKNVRGRLGRPHSRPEVAKPMSHREKPGEVAPLSDQFEERNMPSSYFTSDEVNPHILAQMAAQNDVQTFTSMASTMINTGENNIVYANVPSNLLDVNRAVSALGGSDGRIVYANVLLQHIQFQERRYKDSPVYGNKSAQNAPSPNRGSPSPAPRFPSRGNSNVHRANIEQVNNMMRPEPMPQGLTPLSSNAYRMEKADRKHRFGHLLMQFFDIYQRNPTDTPFFDWLDSLSYFEVYQILKDRFSEQYARTNAPMFVQGVKYLDQASRGDYRITADGAQLRWRGKTFDTQDLETVFSGVGWACWVMSPEKVIYTNSHVVGRWHHSSFLSGCPVLGAGEWMVTGGRVRYITGKTGHYKCDKSTLIKALFVMRSKGVKLEGSQVILWKGGEDPIAIDTVKFLTDATLPANLEVFGSSPLFPRKTRGPKMSDDRAIGSHRSKR